MNLVSVILPTYNRAHLLRRAIDSVLRQTHPHFELIIVDDGSTDNTLEVVHSYHDPRISYLKQEQRGAGAACNAGVHKSKYDLIAFQNSDDEWLETKLEKQLQALAEAGDETGFVYTDMVRIRADGSQYYFSSPVVDSSAIINPVTRQYSVTNIGNQTCLMRKACFLQAGLFNENLPALEDLELYIRLLRITRFLKVAEPLVHYYETAGLMSNHLACAEAWRQILTIYKSELKSDKWFIAGELAKIEALKLRSSAIN